MVKNAPSREYTGHSSHVMNIRMLANGEKVVTAGGRERSVVVWEVLPTEDNGVELNAFR